MQEPTCAASSAADDEARSARTWRTLDAPPARVFGAFADPVRLARWWGPAGFTNRFEVCEFRPGGAWRFVMVGPDGREYPNESRFAVIEAPQCIQIEHLSAPRFDLEVHLCDAGNGRTRLDWCQRFATLELYEALRPIVVPANEQNLDRLAAELAR